MTTHFTCFIWGGKTTERYFRRHQKYFGQFVTVAVPPAVIKSASFFGMSKLTVLLEMFYVLIIFK